MTILSLILIFFKIGVFSFGGGYATIAMLRGEAVTRGWLSAAEFADLVALSQVTPGPIAVNAATFAGYRVAGIAGACAATLGVALPSFILVLAAMRFIAAFKESGWLKALFYGLRPAVIGMTAAAACVVALPEIFPSGGWTPDWRGAAVFAVALGASLYKRVSPFLLLGGAAAVGLLLW